MDFVIDHSYLIPLLPLLGAAAAGFFGARWLKGRSHWPIWIGVGIAAVLSISLLLGMMGKAHGDADVSKGDHAGAAHGDKAGKSDLNRNRTLFTWFQAGDPNPKDKAKARPKDFFKVEAGFWFDPLTAVMLSVVCGIGFFITVFAAGYMKGEEGYFRFFAYLGLFIFMMTLLVMGNNLIMLYMGWEGVGLCSYLLIGYYYEKPSAREAAKKAFLVNRVGDFGFGLGILLSFLAFGTVKYFDGGNGLLELAANAHHPGHWALQYIPFLLMLGAFGKSAQFPLYVWLPDAMEGPTPVSALIHAATMVTAGVYMIARCGTLFVGNSAAMMTIAIVGAFTALFAASIALRQFDLKKVFAYSTISQLGFMFVGVGVLAPVAGVFHLVTHAFFKALLFLSSGVVMHAMSGVLDMRYMSGLKKVLPKTNWLMLIGCAALAGFPLITSGFFSKDEIIKGAFDRGSWIIGLVMLVTAFLTAYYTFRLYFRVFQGPLLIPKPAPDAHGGHGHDDHGTHHSGHGHGGHGHTDDHAHHNHEPWIMVLPLIVLAAGALLSGYLNWPGEALGEFIGKSRSFQMAYDVVRQKPELTQVIDASSFGQEEAHEAARKFPYVMFLSAIISLSGIALAFVLHLYDRARAERLAAGLQPLTGLLEAKYWVDEIYQRAIVEPLRATGRFFFAVDRFVVDGIVAAVSWVPQLAGWTLKLTIQRGSLQGYASAMLFGVVIILVLVFSMS